MSLLKCIYGQLCDTSIVYLIARHNPNKQNGLQNTGKINMMHGVGRSLHVTKTSAEHKLWKPA